MSQSSLVMSVRMAPPARPVAPTPSRQCPLRSQRERGLMFLVPKVPARSSGRGLGLTRAPAPLAALLTEQGRPYSSKVSEGHLVRLLRDHREPFNGPITMTGPSEQRPREPNMPSGYLGGKALQPQKNPAPGAAWPTAGYPAGQTLGAVHTLHTCSLPFPFNDADTGHQQHHHNPALMARDHSVTCVKCHGDISGREILRVVAPHIGPRWRAVGRDLGLSSEDLARISRDNPMSKASELALRVLDLWWRSSDVGNRGRQLVDVLDKHDLTAAGAIVSNRRSTSRPSSSSVLTLARQQLTPRGSDVRRSLAKVGTLTSRVSAAAASNVGTGVYICTPHIRIDELPDDLAEEDPALLMTSEGPQLAPSSVAVKPAFGKPLKASTPALANTHPSTRTKNGATKYDLFPKPGRFSKPRTPSDNPHLSLESSSFSDAPRTPDASCPSEVSRGKERTYAVKPAVMMNMEASFPTVFGDRPRTSLDTRCPPLRYIVKPQLRPPGDRGAESSHKPGPGAPTTGSQVASPRAEMKDEATSTDDITRPGHTRASRPLTRSLHSRLGHSSSRGAGHPARPHTSHGSEEQLHRVNRQWMGKMHIGIFIERVEPHNSRHALLRLQSALMRQESTIIQRLAAVADFTHIQVQHVGTGFLSIVLAYNDPRIVRQLGQKEGAASIALKMALRSILADKAILEEAGVSEVHFRTEISQESPSAPSSRQKTPSCGHKRTHMSPVTTMRMSAGLRRPLDEDLAAKVKENGSAGHSGDLVATLGALLEVLGEDLHTLEKRHSSFSGYLSDFLMVLKLIKPLDMTCIHSQAEVLRCYMALKNSPSVGKNVKLDLVREFLQILDAVAEVADDLHTEISGWSKEHRETLPEQELLLPLVEEMRTYLDPLYNCCGLFNEEAPIKLNALDRSLFSGLVYLIPTLLKIMKDFYDILSFRYRSLEQCSDKKS